MKEDDYKKNLDKVSRAPILNASIIEVGKAVYESTKNIPPFDASTIQAIKYAHDSGIFDLVTKINEQGYYSELQKIKNEYPFDIYSNEYSKLLGTLSYEEKKSLETYEPEKVVEKAVQMRDSKGIETLFPEITDDEAKEFITFLYKYPLLGFKDKKGVGNKIYRELEEKIEHYIVSVGTINLYRYRLWKNDAMADFVEEEMFAPVYGLDNTNRFSCFGKNPLYMSETEETCLEELKNEHAKKTGICVQLRHEAKVLDMGKENIIFEYCNKKKQEGRVNEYILPNFISECCQLISRNKNIQLDGIKYKSTILEGGINYAFFSFGYGNFLDKENKIISNDEIEKKMANIKA